MEDLTCTAGAFIIVCFIVWMIWRLVRARRRRGQGRANVLGGLPKGLTSKVSFLRHRPELSLSGSTINGSPPPTLHEKSGSISSLVGGYYAPDKSQLQAQPQPQPLSVVVPEDKRVMVRAVDFDLRERFAKIELGSRNLSQGALDVKRRATQIRW